MRLSCARCGAVDAVLRWQFIADGRRHIRASCPGCDTFLRFAEQTPENVQAADGAEPYSLGGIETPKLPGME